MAEEITNDNGLMANQIMTQKAQERLTKKLIELIDSEFRNLLTEDLRPVFRNVLIWFDSEEAQVKENLLNFKKEDKNDQ